MAGHGFWSGLLLGLVVSVLVAVVVRRRGAGSGLAGSGAGVAFVVASVLALAGEHTLEAGFALGLLALGVGGLLTARAKLLGRLLVAVPGVVILARSVDVDHPGWATAIMLVTVVVGGVLVADVDRTYAAVGLAPVLLAVTVLGVYVTTPDTDHAVILAGAVLPAAALGALGPKLGLGLVGSAPVVGLVSWVVVTDGAARSGAVVGAFACFGLLVLEPVLRRLSEARRGALELAVAHVALVAVCSRVAGLRTGAGWALVISVAAYAVATALLVARGRRRAPT